MQAGRHHKDPRQSCPLTSPPPAPRLAPPPQQIRGAQQDTGPSPDYPDLGKERWLGLLVAPTPSLYRACSPQRPPPPPPPFWQKAEGGWEEPPQSQSPWGGLYLDVKSNDTSPRCPPSHLPDTVRSPGTEGRAYI